MRSKIAAAIAMAVAMSGRIVGGVTQTGTSDAPDLARLLAPRRHAFGNPGFAPTPGPSGVRAARRMAAKRRNRLRAKGQHRRAVR